MTDKPPSRGSGRRPRPPLETDSLRELALAYVGRFATSARRVADYLARKLRERGWAGATPPDVDGLIARLVELGYIDDAGFAEARARSLTRRGLGARRVRQQLTRDGIAEDRRDVAMAVVEAGSIEALVRFAQRKRLGPFAVTPPPGDAVERRRHDDRAIAAFLRAGHSLDDARLILAIPKGKADAEAIADLLRSRL